MSEIRVNDIIGEDGSGAVNFSKGINISSGVVTATTFKGNFDGDGSSLTGVASTDNIITGVAATFTSGIDVVGSAVTIHNAGIDVTGIITATGGFSGTASLASGLTGTPSIIVQDVTAQMVSVAGTMQYEDVVNVDSAGIGTFKGGLDVVGSAVTIHSKGVHVTGVVTATSFVGSGANLTDVISGTELKQAGTSVGTAVTQINFASGATLTTASLGISTVTIAAGLNTAAQTGATGVITLNLDNAQHHDIYLAAGISTVTCTGGSAGDSHSIVFTHPTAAGVTTVGFSTYFMFPSGSVPVFSGGSNKVDLVSFVIRRQGTAGIGTQLLASAGLDYQ